MSSGEKSPDNMDTERFVGEPVSPSPASLAAAGAGPFYSPGAGSFSSSSSSSAANPGAAALAAAGQWPIGSSSSSSAAPAPAAAGTGPAVSQLTSWLTIGPGASEVVVSSNELEKKPPSPKDPNTVLHGAVDAVKAAEIMVQRNAEPEKFAPEGYASTLKPILIAANGGFVGERHSMIPPLLRTLYNKVVQGDFTDKYWTTTKGKNELEYFNKPDTKAVLARVEDPKTMLLELTDLITQIASPGVVQCLKDKYGGVREFFEKTPAKDQCNVTVLPDRSDISNNPMYDCWICGTPIDFAIPGGKDAKWNSAECEHIFPVAQALCFTGLYEGPLAKRLADSAVTGDTTSPFGFTADEYRKAVSHEYKWAHRICNQVKNDSHFIQYTHQTNGIGTFEIIPSMIESFLVKLLANDNAWGNGRTDLFPYVQYIFKDALGNSITENDWKQQRNEAIKTRCQGLIALANKSGLTPREQARVSAMAVLSTISTSQECAGAVLAEPPVPLSRMRPGDVASVRISFESAKSLVQDTIFYFLQSARLDILIGNLNALFVSHRRDFPKELTGVHRDKITAWLGSIAVPNDVRKNGRLADMAHLIADSIFTEKNIELLRHQVLQYSAKLPTVTNTQTHWSMFQVLFGQVILGVLYDEFARNINDILLRVSPPESMREGEFPPILTMFLNSPGQPSLVMSEAIRWSEDYTSVLLAFLAQLSGYDNQLAVIKSYHIVPNDKLPPWFLPQTTVPVQTSEQDKAVAKLLTQPKDEYSKQLVPSSIGATRNKLYALRQYILSQLAIAPQNITLNNALNQIENEALVFFRKGNVGNALAVDYAVRKSLNIRREGGRRLRTYRKPTRARSSLRTRRARHSGLSKRLKKRSSRKSRTGKLMKRTRY